VSARAAVKKERDAQEKADKIQKEKARRKLSRPRPGAEAEGACEEVDMNFHER
jgi:hypothetical protein